VRGKRETAEQVERGLRALVAVRQHLTKGARDQGAFCGQPECSPSDQWLPNLRVEIAASCGVCPDSACIAVIASAITPSNSSRPCFTIAEQVKIAGSFSNHPEMRS